MLQTMFTDVQQRLARRVSDTTKIRFYDFNIGWSRALVARMNDFGFVLNIVYGKPTFVKEHSPTTDIRTDNIYVPTPLALTIAAHKILQEYTELKTQFKPYNNPFGARPKWDRAFEVLLRRGKWPGNF